MASKRKAIVHVVNTGGTIASRFDPAAAGWRSTATAAELIACVPELPDIAELRMVEHSQLNGYRIDTRTVFELTLRLRKLLAQDDVDGVVVTHGTATLEETAYLLDVTLNSPKPVVITGAQRRFDDPGADGPMNLFSAVRLAADPAAREHGVLAVFDSRIYSARDVAKVHTHSLAAFDGRDGGAIGHSSRDGVLLLARPERRVHLPVERIVENVQLVKLVQGGDDLLLRACVLAPVAGIVLEGISSGHAHDPAYAAIRDALAAGIPVVTVPRVLSGGNNLGGTQYAHPGSIQTLIREGVIAGGFLSGLKARILLMVALATTRDRDHLQEIFSRA